VRRSDIADNTWQGEITSTVYSTGEATIRVTDNYNLESQVICRLTDYTGVVGSAEFAKHRNIEACVQVLQNSSLVSAVIIKQFDVDHSNWQAYVNGGYYRSHKVSSAIIRVKCAYLFSKAMIRTSARWWRPNIEGELVFADRKLPRQWVRENFIP
jgi:hypothetical protein